MRDIEAEGEPPAMIEVAATITSQSHGWVILKMARAIIVLSRDEFKAGLQRGKWWTRHALMQQRLGAQGATAPAAAIQSQN